jgi:two-component system sensor histidine kinase QseC
MATVDLGALMRRVVAELAGRALDKAQEIEFEAEPEGLLQGDELLLAVLARNLVDNAIRYSPRGARVRVQVMRKTSRTVLRVEDSGPGLTPAQTARLGERFFRVQGTGESGSGLGWSIVRRLTQAMGLSVEVHRSTDLGGLAVEVAGPALPCAASTSREPPRAIPAA